MQALAIGLQSPQMPPGSMQVVQVVSSTHDKPLAAQC